MAMSCIFKLNKKKMKTTVYLIITDPEATLRLDTSREHVDPCITIHILLCVGKK